MKIFISFFILAGLIAGIMHEHSSISTQDLIKSNRQKPLTVADDTLIIVKKCHDFNLTGNGNNTEWQKATWNRLTKLDTGGKAYVSRFKMMYSEKGIYLLFNGEDDKITTQSNQDFGKIYEGDAFEVFFHTNPQVPIYFEYEINQLNKQLILVITRINDKGYSWIPWQYENGKRNYNIVDVAGGKAEPGSNIKSWSAEVFFPYPLIDLLANVPPKSGTVWNANFCRLDYDSGNMIKWSWSPTIKKSFHELEKFRPIKFE